MHYSPSYWPPDKVQPINHCTQFYFLFFNHLLVHPSRQYCHRMDILWEALLFCHPHHFIIEVYQVKWTPPLPTCPQRGSCCCRNPEKKIIPNNSASYGIVDLQDLTPSSPNLPLHWQDQGENHLSAHGLDHHLRIHAVTPDTLQVDVAPWPYFWWPCQVETGKSKGCGSLSSSSGLYPLAKPFSSFPLAGLAAALPLQLKKVICRMTPLSQSLHLACTFFCIGINCPCYNNTKNRVAVNFLFFFFSVRCFSIALITVFSEHTNKSMWHGWQITWHIFQTCSSTSQLP